VEQLEDEQPEHPPPPPEMGVDTPPAILDIDENADTLLFEDFPQVGQSAESADFDIGRINSN
jgi:hypothetical protein